MKLSTGIIHLWLACPDDINDPVLLSNYMTMLSDEEKVNMQRFYFAKHRHQYLVTRALIRSTLSYYVDIPPKDWHFSVNDYGKPEIANEVLDIPLRFNLSHTDGLIVCALVLENDIGVDIETMQRTHTSLDIAKHYFSKQEFASLQVLAKHKQAERFLQYWTLKEAYIKAKGLGLSLPLDQFSFFIEEQQPIRVEFDPCLNDDANTWQFWQFYPSKQHIAAVALKSNSGIRFELEMHKVIPLQRIIGC